MGFFSSLFSTKDQIKELEADIEHYQRAIKKIQQDLKGPYDKERLRKDLANYKKLIQIRKENIAKLKKKKQ